MTNESKIDELRDLLTQRSRELCVPGCAVGVIFDGRQHVFLAGVTSTDAPVAVDGDTLFMIGSTTKTVTATALLSLVDEGSLRLDAPVRSYLRSLPLNDDEARRTLTLRHLLTHTGGFEGDVADDEDWGDDALARSIDTFGLLPQYAPPGTAFSYSNAGLRLAGRLLEVVTGRPYETAVRERVLEPLGMARSFFFPWEVYSRRHAVGHVVDGAPSVAHTWGLGRSAAPEGGLLSSIADQLRFAQFHLDGTFATHAPISDALRAEMQRAQLPAAPPFDAVGLPWLLVDTHGTRAVTHGGNIAGVQLSSMLLMPEAGFAITALTNAGPGRQLGAELTDWCLENLLGLPRSPAFVPTGLTEADLAAFDGRYDSGTWGMDIVTEQGWLRASFFLNDARPEEVRQLPPPMELAFCGPDEVVRPDAPADIFGRFQRDPTGAVVRLLCQGQAMRRLPEPAVRGSAG